MDGIKYQCFNLFCVLNIINQSMPNTLNTSPCLSVAPQQLNNTKFILKPSGSGILAFLFVLFVNLVATEAKETVIVDHLNTKNDKILLQLLQETHNYIEYERYISATPYLCKSILKNDLTKNHPEKITNIGLHLDYPQVISLKRKEILLNYEASEMESIRQVDKILDILNGKCLYYTTNAFIYEYCHKEHVRQFDTAWTKAYNVKQEFEDISMGVFSPEDYKAKRLKKGKVELTPEQRKIVTPELSDFATDYNFLYIDDINKQGGSVQLQESEDGNFLFSNAHHIMSVRSLNPSPVVIEVDCYQKQENGSRAVQNYALVIDSYTFLYTHKQGTCDQFISHRIVPHTAPYQQDDAIHPIRVYGKYLYGKVEQTCTKKLAWMKNKYDNQFDNYFKEGSLLFLELYNSHKGQVEYHYVTIKKVISQSLIEIDTILGKSFDASHSEAFINSSAIKTKRIIKNITKCEFMFNKRLRLNESVKLSYVNSGIVKINSSITAEKGKNIGCICKSSMLDSVKIIDLDITVTNHLWLGYYQTLIKTNSNVFTTQSYNGMEFMLRECSVTCFTFSQDQEPAGNESGKKSFTKIVKLARNTPEYHFNASESDNFYVLAVKGNGIIKLITRSKDGLLCTYLITEGQIIKVVEFPNGTKEITKENKIYENSTTVTEYQERNYVYIKVSRLPNGTHFGGIWKLHDLAFFPRFTLFGEELVSLHRTSGYAYLRILNLDNMKNKRDLAVVSYMNRLAVHYSMKEKMEADPTASLFLNQSFSVNYTYISGKYCDNLNKFRKTIVNLKCGSPWFLITKLLETSPCEYFIEIKTALLCRQGFKSVLENDQSLLNKLEPSALITEGVLCHPYHFLDEAEPYLYIPQLG